MIVTAPTPERHRHGRVTRDSETLADSDGAIGLPYRVEGLLGRLERHGDITASQRHAGEEFARLFALAHLDPMQAASMMREGGGKAANTPHGSDRARHRVLAALDAVGGINSPGGACAWHVLGSEQSLRHFAIRQGWSGRSLRPEVAKGTLIVTLGVLAKHFHL